MIPQTAPPASALNIAGLVPMSTVDWPGKLVATVFCQGCPWRCPYCHNHRLIPIRVAGTVAWSEVESLLSRRSGLLDGVVFSGGEATVQPALAAAMREVKETGFLVGLHTAGAYPTRLEQLLTEGLVDWVGLDIKALPENYHRVAGVDKAGELAWRSLAVALDSGVGLEVRVTVFPDGPRDALEVAHLARSAGVKNLALQVARPDGAPLDFQADRPGWVQWHQNVAAAISRLGFPTFTYR